MKKSSAAPTMFEAITAAKTLDDWLYMNKPTDEVSNILTAEWLQTVRDIGTFLEHLRDHPPTEKQSNEPFRFSTPNHLLDSSFS